KEDLELHRGDRSEIARSYVLSEYVHEEYTRETRPVVSRLAAPFITAFDPAGLPSGEVIPDERQKRRTLLVLALLLKHRASRKLRAFFSGSRQISRRRPAIRHLTSKNTPQNIHRACGTSRAPRSRMADDGRLDDDQPMPETLDSLGRTITALGKQ